VVSMENQQVEQKQSVIVEVRDIYKDVRYDVRS